MVDTSLIATLRTQTGAGMMECKTALEEAQGDLARAEEILRKKGVLKAAKKSDRSTGQGLIHSYIHGNGTIGAMIELQCETDFVARNPAFQELAHDLAMQIAASAPLYVAPEDVPQDVIAKEKEIASGELVGKPAAVAEKIIEGKLQKYFSDVCLLKQSFFKNEDITVEELIAQKIAQLGENIRVARFARFAIGR